MDDLYLVSCVSKKINRRAPARDLYCSEWFRKARSYVEATGSPWLILSAKYHLVAPETVLDPYNTTLKNMAVNERRSWADEVLLQFDKTGRCVDRVIFLAGERYREFLLDGMKRRGVRVHVPMAGLGIGQQLAWLKAHSP